MRARLLTSSAAALLAAACGATPTSAPVARPPSEAPPPAVVAAAAPAAAAAGDARCQALARRGIVPCPPGGLRLEAIAIRNGTGGAIDDAAAKAEGAAYLRSHALYQWAVGQDGGSAFLLSGALVPPQIARTNIFRGEARIFSDALAAGARVSFEPLRTTEVTLVPVPADLQRAALRQGLTPSPYAWVDNQSGPARVTLVGRDGSSRTVVDIPAGEPHPILVFGEVRVDPDLGIIWYQGGVYGCLTTSELRATCQIP